MSLFDRFKEKVKSIGDGSDRIQIGDPRFHDWETVHQFEDLATGLAWRDVLREHGIPAELTSDWELDRFNRGDIHLQVPPGMWSEAEELVSGLDLE
ncbi:MAG: hypothetical protein KDB54_10275 [Solirubrobacterales bacterium]|nr:hypothetical protein [Solirubrobacterales bacterium]MCB0861028.1 hypothetical protein [Solirubrobacterales bacterium]HRV59607.1 hypothetical protein [Solirubrobacterales bacterium]